MFVKNADKKELPDAIREISRGKTYLSFEAGQAIRKNNESVQIPAITRRKKYRA